jgi:O-antigen/teichoic acid export membrane protein
MSFNSALGWSYVMQGGQYAITTLVTFVLAAVLGPSDFGLVAMALVYLLFIQMVLRQGMVPALVQRRELDTRHVNSAFWLIMGTGVVLTAVSLLLSGWWSDVNRTPELETVINVMSVLIPLQALVVVQEALLSRHMDFRGLAMRTNASALIGGVVGLVMAFTGFGVWALVAMHVVKSVVDVVVLWTLSDWRPTWSFAPEAAREMLAFSSAAALGSLGSFASSRADALLIGVFFGPTVVGLYRLAQRLVELVTYFTTSALQAVSLPELSRVQGDPQRLSERIMMIIQSAALVALPPLGLLAGSSGVIMQLLGDEWEPATSALSVLCVVGSVVTLTIFTGPILMAVGQPRLFAVVTWLSAGFSVGSFLLAGLLLADAPVDDQVVGVALTRAAVFAPAILVIAGWVVTRYARVSLSQTLKRIGPAVLTGGIAFLSTRLLVAVPWPGGEFVQALFVVVPGALLTVALLWMVDPTARGVLTKVAGKAFRI